MSLKIVTAGASGLIGSELMKLLLQDVRISSITALVRKPLDITHTKLKQLVIDFDLLELYKDKIEGDIVFCSLGSTRKKTPNLADYRKIDYHYPIRLAKIAKQNNFSQFHIVTALGSDANSSNYYNRMKGELERDLKKLNLESLHIYQPSLLTGNRKEKRVLEKIAIVLMHFINPFLKGKSKKFRIIAAEKAAKAMFNQAHKNLKGIYVYPSDKIQELA